MGSNRLDILLGGDSSQLRAALEEAEQASRDSMAAMAQHAQDAAGAMALLGASGLALTKTFIDAEAPLEQTEAKMLTLSKSVSGVRGQVEKLKAFQDANKIFDLESLEKSSMTIENFGGNVDKLLPLAASLGAQFGDIEGKSKVLALAMEGNTRGMTQIQKQTQITTEELVKAGAQVDAHGKITAKGTLALDAYREALTKVVETKYGDAIKNQNETMIASFDQLKHDVTEAFAEIGTELAPTIKMIVGGIDGMVKSFRELPDSVKGIIGIGALATGIIGSLAAVIIGTTAALGPAALAYTVFTANVAASAPAAEAAAIAAQQLAVWNAALAESTGVAALGVGELSVAELAATGATTGLIASMGVVALGIAAAVTPVLALGAGFAGLIALMGMQNKADAEELDSQERMAKAFRGSTQTIVECRDALKQFGDVGSAAADHVADSMRKAGKTNIDVTKAILESMVLLQKAEQDGNKDQIAKNEATIKLLQQVRVELDGTVEAQERATKAAKTAQDQMVTSAQAAFDKFKENKSGNVFVDPKAELEAIDVVIGQLSVAAKFDKDLQAELQKLQLERIAIVRKAREEDLRADRDGIKLLVEEGNMSKAQEAAALRDLAEKYKEFAEKRRALLIEAATLDRKAAEEQLQAEAKVLEARKAAAETHISGLEEQLKKGGDLVAQQAVLTKAIQERAKLEEQIVKAQLAAEEKRDPAHRVQLEAEASSKIQGIHEKLAQAIIKLSDEVRAHEVQRLEASVRVAESAVKGADAEISSLRERLKVGESVGKQLEDELKTREKLEEAAIRAKKAVVEKSEQDPEARAAKLKALDEEIAANRKKLITEVAKVQADADARHKKDIVDAATLDEKIAKAKVEGMQAELKLGKEMDASYMQAILERQKAEDAALRAKVDAEEAGKNGTEVARIEKGYLLDMAGLAKQHREEQEKIKEEIEAQTAAIKAQKDEITGKAMSMQDAFKAMHDDFNFDEKPGQNSAANDDKLAFEKRNEDQYMSDLQKAKGSGGSTPDQHAAEASKQTASINEESRKQTALLEKIAAELAHQSNTPTQVKIGGSSTPTATENSSDSWIYKTNGGQ